MTRQECFPMLDDIAEKIGILRSAVPIRRRIPAHLLQAQKSIFTPFAVRIFLPCFLQKFVIVT